MLLSRLKVGTRIYVGFGSLIVVALLIAVTGYSGIDSLGRQTVKMTGLVGNIRYVASALQNQELIARLMLRASIEPDDTMKARFSETQTNVRESLTQARAKTTSPVRKEIYESALGKLDGQAQSATKLFDLGRKMVDARAKLFSGGTAMTAATVSLLDAAAKSASPDVIAAASAIERDFLLMRVANWRFLATHDAAGPAGFRAAATQAQSAIDTFDKLDAPGLATFSKPVREMLTAYRDAFEVTAPAIIEMAEIYNTVQRPTVNAMQAELAKADESLARDTAEAAVVSASVHDSTTSIQIIVAGLGLIGGLALAFFIGRSITRPIAGMTAAMATLAAGNHDVTIPGADSLDEIGDMARAVNVFKTNMIETERLTAEQEAARADGSRRREAMDQHTREFGGSVTGVMSALGTAAGNLRRAADIMAESASAVHHQASETAGGAGKSSGDLIAVAAAVEQFTASVSEIARQVAVASDVAGQAVQRAEASQTTIRGLAESTSRIGDVVRLIDSIAGQTNLLALNATIEAARAGDAGKGFAVVAGEVKALAAQTAKATAEIGAQIETVRSATEDTVAAMNEIGGIIGKMGEVSTAISAAVEEQSVTTREIASSIQGVAGSTTRAAQAMENVVRVADQAGDASRNILSEATAIGSESEKLRHQVEQFLKAVQADAGEGQHSNRSDAVTAMRR
jgi:methyl-accepting chemotaxis protein